MSSRTFLTLRWSARRSYCRSVRGLNTRRISKEKQEREDGIKLCHLRLDSVKSWWEDRQHAPDYWPLSDLFFPFLAMLWMSHSSTIQLTNHSFSSMPSRGKWFLASTTSWIFFERKQTRRRAEKKKKKNIVTWVQLPSRILLSWELPIQFRLSN